MKNLPPEIGTPHPELSRRLVNGRIVIGRELKADPKAIRETLRRQREQRGVKVSASKLP